MRISDISVSRIHSKIYFQDNKLFLEDCGSKFGTLVLAKDEVEISENVKVIQIGRTLISSCLSNGEIKNHQYNHFKYIRTSDTKLSVNDTKPSNIDKITGKIIIICFRFNTF